MAGIIILAVSAAWISVKQVAVHTAENRARQILTITESDDPDTFIRNTTAYVFEHFTRADPSENFSLKIRSLVTHPSLPEFIRLPDGVIETLIETGMCDNAGRYLAFVLQQAGYESVQWNMVTPHGAHAARLVTYPDTNKTAVLADPYFGFVLSDRSGHLTHPKVAKRIAHRGYPFDKTFIALSPESDPRFYQHFKDVSMSAQGEPLIISATLPKIRKPLYMGKIDSDDKDVKNKTKSLGMSPNWNYIGHRYEREWVRILKAPQDMHLEITLVSGNSPHTGTIDPPPAVDGKNLSWDLKAGDKITFYDGRAHIALPSFKSYTIIDQIAVFPE